MIGKREMGFVLVVVVLMAGSFAAARYWPLDVEEYGPAPSASVVRILKTQEGFRGQPYQDALGHATIGYGTQLPLTEAEATLLLEYRLDRARTELASRWQPFDSQPHHIRQALLLMAYQLGVSGELKFVKMLAAIQAGDIATAVAELHDSLWDHQSPLRTAAVAALLESR